ncbi:MAG: ferritin family protein [Terriglobales bacterium]
MKQDFSSLSPREALRIAIAIEARNAQIYHQLSDLLSHFCPDFPDIASSFLDLARAEHQHGELLTARYCERYGNKNDDITEEDIRDFIETPRFEIASIVEAVEKGQPASAHRIALEIADAAERSALHYYRRLAATTLDPQLKALYEEFVRFEQEHTDRLETDLGTPTSTLTPIKGSPPKAHA